MVVSWYWWVVFGGFVAVLFASDLGALGRCKGAIDFHSALSAIALRVGLAAIFNAGIYMGWVGGYETPKLQQSAGLEFLAAYLVEIVLSLDNMFVFALIFRHFRVEGAAQHRVLLWGVLGALGMRGIFILAGLQILYFFQWATYLFGGVLIVAGIRMLVRPNEHSFAFLVERWARQCFPVSKDFHKSSFFIRENDRILVTPLFVILLIIEATDLIFAVDSIPAVFGVTRDTFILLTSNALAILGLRAMYFALAGCVDRFRFLHLGLSAALVFIGLKMMLSHTSLCINAVRSLTVILALLSGSVLASLILAAPKK
ncbi:Inner membrane protein alx [Candidatus Xiphinematobacter sp. Idaho Grape]|uniref:TerC/Alx family metal homeostasis membrane protein n=1 Tax=Candidatus Xiphinematobacter sp. Idaho Grape TaxID=1704307 RepID=UPI0007062282|nr:TerC/Alx family metal homeostasis membrane protein [Candidatus Xiphinematobacter sp. Idaho Grape]ALJ56382.1 Inner membrane protein alx [Candidatus Xiphinematobacter sp. Idaho Grape]